MVEANTQCDADDEWLEELLGQPGSSLTRHQTATAAVSRVEAVASAPGRASHAASAPGCASHDASAPGYASDVAAATSKRTLRAPPSIEAIKRMRLERESSDSKHKERWQQ